MVSENRPRRGRARRPSDAPARRSSGASRRPSSRRCRASAAPFEHSRPKLAGCSGSPLTLTAPAASGVGDDPAADTAIGAGGLDRHARLRSIGQPPRLADRQPHGAVLAPWPDAKARSPCRGDRPARLRARSPVVQRAGHALAVDDALLKRPALVRAAVVEREDLAVAGAEDRDVAGGGAHHPRAARAECRSTRRRRSTDGHASSFIGQQLGQRLELVAVAAAPRALRPGVVCEKRCE